MVTLFIFGAVVLLTAWLPLALRHMPLSLPICCVVIGMLLTWSPLAPLPRINLLDSRKLTEHLTEFVVIVAFMGAGLKIDRPLGWRRWAMTWRLLGIAMPISIGMIALLGWGVLGLEPPPRSCSVRHSRLPIPYWRDVQVGPPQTGEEDDIRFALTSEAGLNDGLSFPFVMAAIAVTSQGSNHHGSIAHWFAVHGFKTTNLRRSRNL
ncbi:hypothetical protein [Rhizobium lusitanum]|uniref:hypothetical protein n=1 Tax=Rhizobium lusitanum TaxID=293958 RepID=UPI00195887F0|nr:hypothetical protein [Rhizobium lusitanum]